MIPRSGGADRLLILQNDSKASKLEEAPPTMEETTNIRTDSESIYNRAEDCCNLHGYRNAIRISTGVHARCVHFWSLYISPLVDFRNVYFELHFYKALGSSKLFSLVTSLYFSWSSPLGTIFPLFVRSRTLQNGRNGC